MPGADARTARSGSQGLDDTLTRMVRFSEKLESLHRNQIRFSLVLEYALMFSANTVLLAATLIFDYAVSLQQWICACIGISLCLISGFLTWRFQVQFWSRLALVSVIAIHVLFCLTFQYAQPVKGLVLGLVVAHAFVWPLSAGALAEACDRKIMCVFYFLSIPALPATALLTVREWSWHDGLVEDLVIAMLASACFSVGIFVLLFKTRATTMRLTRDFLADSRSLVNKLESTVYLEKVNRLIDSLAEAARASEDPRLLRAVKALVRVKSRNTTERVFSPAPPGAQAPSSSEGDFLSNMAKQQQQQQQRLQGPDSDSAVAESPASPILEHLRESYVKETSYRVYAAVSDQRSAALVSPAEKRSAHVFMSTLPLDLQHQQQHQQQQQQQLFKYASTYTPQDAQQLLLADEEPLTPQTPDEPRPAATATATATATAATTGPGASPSRSERIRRALVEASETDSQISAQAPEESERPVPRLDQGFFAPLAAFGDFTVVATSEGSSFTGKLVQWNALQDWDEAASASAAAAAGGGGGWEAEVGRWRFDAFALAVETQGRPLSSVGYKLIGRELRQLASQQEVSPTSSRSEILTVEVRDQLTNFLEAVESRYMNNNPYHNAIHAADVTNSVAALYELSSQQPYGDERNRVQQLHGGGVFRVAGLVAATVHDVNHLGKSNRWHVQRQDAVGVLYNDLSPLENMHAACGLYLLQCSSRNFLHWLSDQEYSLFRRAVISAVLATDGKMHMDLLRRLKALAVEEHQIPQLSVLELFLKAADIGHMGKAPAVHMKWTVRVYMEFFAEGDAEAACGLPVGPLNNRKNVRIDEAQAGFSSFIVRPVFELLKDWLLSDRFDREVLDLLAENERTWKSGKLANLNITATEANRLVACPETMRAPAGKRIAWAAEDELHTLKASTSVANPSSSLSRPPSSRIASFPDASASGMANVQSEARAYAVRVGADPGTPGVVKEISAFLKSPLPPGWRRFETEEGVAYFARDDKAEGASTQWEHPDEERLFRKFENITSFPGSSLWVWQQRRKLQILNERRASVFSLVRPWKRRPIIRAEQPVEDEEGGIGNSVLVELLASGYPKLNYQLVKTFARYFSVLGEDIGRVSFLLKIAAVCPLPPDVHMEMKNETCIFRSPGERSSTRHPSDNFFQVVFDNIAPDSLPATPVTQFPPGNFCFNWETDALVISDKPFRRRALSRAFLDVVEQLGAATQTSLPQTTLEMAFQGISDQNVSLVLTALGDVVSLVHEVAKTQNRPSADLNADLLADSTAWPAVSLAAKRTLHACRDFLASDATKSRPTPDKAERVSPRKPERRTEKTGAEIFAIADSDDEDAEELGASGDEEEDEEETECEVIFGNLEAAIGEYPRGSALFTEELLEQLTVKELAATVKFLEAAVEAGNEKLVKAMEQRDDLSAELVHISNRINFRCYVQFVKMWQVDRKYVPVMMATEALLLSFLVFGPRILSAFVARKMCHSISGLCMLLMGSSFLEGRIFVYLVCLASLAMTWEIFGLKAFWFGKRRDIGITVYLIIVAIWFAAQLPVDVLAPVFFADPAGAIVGKIFSRYAGRLNPRWIDEKTICGSIAVLVVTFFTVYQPSDSPSRWTVAVCAALVEAAGGAFDNLLIAAVVIGAWLVSK